MARSDRQALRLSIIRPRQLVPFCGL